MSEPRPSIVFESVRPPEFPPVAALADVLRDAGFEPEYRRPMEQRSAGISTGIALYLLGGVSNVLLERLVDVVLEWLQTHVVPLARGRDIPTITVPLFGPRGEVLREIVVEVDDGKA